MKTLLSAISHFSILKGVLSPDRICAIAKTLGYESVALTDISNLYGLPAFFNACKEHDLTPVIAAEVEGHDGSALLYAHGDKGYANLCRIISGYHCDDEGKRKDTFSLAGSLLEDSSGIWAASGDVTLLSRLREGVEHLYYRMTRPRRPPQEVRKLSIPCLIAPPMLLNEDGDFDTHKLLRAIHRNTILSRLDEKEICSRSDRFRSWENIENTFEAFEDALRSTREFMDAVVSRTDFGTPLMPVFPCDGSPQELLRQKAYEGARRRYGGLSDAVVKRLDYELGLIGIKHFGDYFLIVDDIVRQSPRTCGRGSGAASIVAYSLGITNVDPIRYNLMFERFLNPGRKDPPDIDVDFAWDERDDVLEYVFRRFGKEHTAMVATHLTCGVRMAIREVGRIFGCTESEISRVSKKIPYFLDLPDQEPDLEQMLYFLPATKDMELDPPWPQVLVKARTIIGMPRGIGTHCGGVVITPGPIRHAVPVQYSAKGFPIIQWEKDGAEELGLVKIDLLGNRSLAVIRDAVVNIKEEGAAFDEHRWDPQSDPATVNLLARGESMGVFYVESPAMRLLQRKSGKGDFDHLVIHSSIIRPAANRFIQEYLRRLHGGAFSYPDPRIGEVLSETYGIMVYQEDVSKVAIALAGFSFEEADMLRKIMAKKARGRRLEEFRVRFYEGARSYNVKEPVIAGLWEMMLSFCGYSFCKPHSASYVQVSFQSAYLKTHFAAAFMAAVLSNYGGYYTTQAYISETQRLGIGVIPPDVNSSEIKYKSKGNAIVVGLCQIKSLTRRAQEIIIKERNDNGLYAGLEDFLSRTGIDESDAERLLLAGACDRLCGGLGRGKQFWRMRCYYRLSRGEEKPPELPPMSPIQFLRYQYRTLGFLTPLHPVSLIPRRKKNIAKAIDLEKRVGDSLTILAWCVTSKTVSTQLGESMEFVSFEDETAIFEAVFFPDVYRRYAGILSWQEAFYITGKVSEEYGAVSLEVRYLERP